MVSRKVARLVMSIVAAYACNGGTPRAESVVTLPSSSATPIAARSADASAPPAPDKPDVSAFLAAGCTRRDGYEIDCTQARIDGVGECDEPMLLQPSPSTAAGLEPRATLVQCRWRYERVVDGGLVVTPGLSETGCMLREAVGYVAHVGGRFVMLRTPKDLARVFAPVTTAEEAMSFAELLTGAAAYRAPFTPPAGARVRVPGVLVTRPEAILDGWKMRVFTQRFCGCGPHTIYGIDVVVTRSGEVHERGREDLWEDPKQDGLCVD